MTPKYPITDHRHVRDLETWLADDSLNQTAIFTISFNSGEQELSQQYIAYLAQMKHCYEVTAIPNGTQVTVIRPPNS